MREWGGVGRARGGALMRRGGGGRGEGKGEGKGDGKRERGREGVCEGSVIILIVGIGTDEAAIYKHVPMRLMDLT